MANPVRYFIMDGIVMIIVVLHPFFFTIHFNTPLQFLPHMLPISLIFSYHGFVFCLCSGLYFGECETCTEILGSKVRIQLISLFHLLDIYGFAEGSSFPGSIISFLAI